MEGRPMPSPRAARASALRAAALLLACLAANTGCSSQGGIKQAFGKTLQAVGIGDAPAQPRELPVYLHAGENLNAGDGQRALSLVVRVYQLRGRERFDDAAFEVFLDAQRERDVLGGDLIRVTEVLLAPGQRHELVEPLPADGSHIGVVALFRQPAQTRWRFTFDARKPGEDGITVGLHACAMTTTSTALQTALASPAHSLSSSRCAQSRG
jgi:type VI secretion system protein VasD